ncbi:ATP-binding protein [Telluria beijingensis]|uniref:ATP-binding protein n=1 Tax=Telluria beijingensis TaxID=3068633 RepID=UPI002795C269|nr:ATP-binding protein [Massilia sp. REN29]
MSSATERAAGLVVGTVESVAADEIYVLLTPEAPQTTALNTGVPTIFPRLNGYVLLPNECGATVGFISWIGIDRGIHVKGRRESDLGLVDLPHPIRRMKISPLGTLATERNASNGEVQYCLRRGVSSFPSVGDQVLIPTSQQIGAIVGVSEPGRSVKIGTSPAGACDILVDPNKLFGRHLAVLGNTGSGKSCTVAGLIHWSLEAARKSQSNSGSNNANARFLLLDPNGEYAKAFEGSENARVFRPGASVNALEVPAWFWNSHEWAAVSQAQPGTQRPLLNKALRNLRAGRSQREEVDTTISRQLHLYSSRVNAYISDSSGKSYAAFPGSQEAAHCLRSLRDVMRSLANRLDEGPEQDSLVSLAEAANAVFARRTRPGRAEGEFYVNGLNVLDFEELQILCNEALQHFPTIEHSITSGEDDPVPFDVSSFADYIDDLAADGAGNTNLSSFIAYLTLRIRSLTSNRILGPVIQARPETTLCDWLNEYLGADEAATGEVAIIDLSLVPSDATHIVVAVLARMTFEALQRYRKTHPEGKTLPTVMVLEEAHNFIKRGKGDEDGVAAPARLCREAFEKIAREGRKFGLGLVLSSQRPSELSPTILAQCNTFLLHRIVNDSDQELVSRLVPDNVGALLRELPSLPSRQAILLGWATPVPVLVEISELSEAQRPWSDDPDFWEVWSGEVTRQVDWDVVARDWIS